MDGWIDGRMDVRMHVCMYVCMYVSNCKMSHPECRKCCRICTGKSYDAGLWGGIQT
jgi:hypothetical protein